MAKQVINIGATANDGTGTPLRTSFDYTNQNFTELYNGSGIGTSTNTQVLFNDSGVANGDAGLVYNKTTDALSVGGTLGVTGAATLSSTLAVTGTSTLTGAATLSSTLAVTGASTLTGAATVQGLTVGKGGGAVNENTALGVNVFNASTTSGNATGVGYEALKNLTTAVNCTGIGYNALKSVTTGNNNTGIGERALLANVTGNNSTAVGYGCLISATGSGNTVVGADMMYQLVTGNNNTSIGYTAGSSQLSGSNNAFFGYNAQAVSTTGSNQYTYGNGSVTSHRFEAGDVVLGTGNVVVASAKGIDFSATANSSGTMTSELLNDYEEGTWVPTDGSSAGLTFTVSECKYTKIGRAVTIQGSISYPVNANGLAGEITGLPFAFVGMAPFSISYTSAALVGGVTTVAYLIGHFSDGPLFYNSTGTQTLNSALSNGTIWVFGTYMI